MTAELKLIPLSLVDDHPDNPRLVYRDDVVSGIAATLNGEYPQKHAIHARPFEGRYQTLSGHHRNRAAVKAGLDQVWAWVEPMADDAALMELVLSNRQGELSPLEIGMHVLKAVPKAQGKAGKGLAEYAEKIGKAKSYVTEASHAAEVAIGNLFSQENKLLDKYKHLAAIHSLPPACWPVMVAALVKHGWSAADTAHWVARVAEFNIPDKWQAVFLSNENVIARFLDTKEFSPKTAAALVARCESIETTISDRGVDVESNTVNFHKWLADNAGGESWDVRKLEAYERELLASIDEAANSIDDVWKLGNWREHVGSLDDGSVTLALTDPPYGMDYQSDFRLDRRQDRKHSTIDNDSNDAAVEIEECLKSLWVKMADNSSVLCFCHWSNEHDIRCAVERAGYKVRNSIIWLKNNTGMGDPNTTFAPKHERIIFAVKGSPRLFEREADVVQFDRANSERHPTEKPVPLLSRLIEVLTVAGELVVDPFGGVASTLVAARRGDRRFWGCELKEEYHAIGKERLAAG